MNKLLVICGPTAVGKTQTAIKLARKFYGEIVSVDSRQVYRGLDIATGKDLQTYGDVRVHMLDVVEPTESFSVAQYQNLAHKVIKDIWQRKKLPILVGGTGLYIRAVVDGIETINIPPNEKLRKEYENKSASELSSILVKIAPQKARSMNDSDRQNPRRLIRAIEIASHISHLSPRSHFQLPISTLQIGLTASAEVLKKNINNRILRWIKKGAENEVKKLLASGVSWNSQAFNSIGYREWKGYFEGKKSKDKVLEEWKKNEWQYAKRQITWFKKNRNIVWFDVEKPDWHENMARTVDTWYNS